MSLFNDQEDAILDSLFGSTSPATYDLALSNTAPNEDGTNINEPSGNGYARVSINNNATNFPAASGGVKNNNAIFAFPQATGTWGAALGWWVLFDSTTPVLWGELSPAKVIGNGDVLRIPVGQMTITCD